MIARRSIPRLGITWVLVACSPEITSPEPEAALVSPTPEPGPYLAQTTWGGRYVEYWSELVEADTHLNLNIEWQENGRLECLLYHLWGTLSVDGVDVPEAQGEWITGSYTYPGLIELSREYYGHALVISIELGRDALWMDVTLDLDEGSYSRLLSIYPYEYIPFDT